MKKPRMIVAAFLMSLLLSATVIAGPNPPDAAVQPDTAPTTGPSVTTTTRQAVPDGKVLATVGDAKITAARINRLLAELPAQVPPKKVLAIRDGLLKKMIFRQLVYSSSLLRRIEVTDKELAAEKSKLAAAASEKKMTLPEFLRAVGITESDIPNEIRNRKLIAATVARDKVDAFIKAQPDYFNGTKVRASHILIKSEPVAPTVEQIAAREKLKRIVAEINSGKIAFDKAALKYSQDPGSAARGGDLGEFTFDRMVTPFAEAAFALEVGQTSDVVQSAFGFHLIKVTGRTGGKEQPGPKAPDVARRTLMGQIQAAMFAQALDATPIVIIGDSQPASAPAEGRSAPDRHRENTNVTKKSESHE